MPTQIGLDIGMYLPNTTWHNAPFAARFVQDAQVGALHFTEVLRLTVWFYPQNSELLHSAGVLFLGTDFLSPLINIGWMALCLLAAWSFGRPYAGGAVALLGLALVLDAEMLLLYQPGDAKNDIAGLFFLLAAAAILVNAEAQARAATRAASPIAGGAGEASPSARAFHSGGSAAAGGAPGRRPGRRRPRRRPRARHQAQPARAIRPAHARRDRGRRRATGCGPPSIWVASSLITGGFWFARNLVEAGNPLPWARRRAAAGPRPARHRHPRAAHGLRLPHQRRRDQGLLHPRPARQLRRPLAADPGRRDRRLPARDLPRAHADRAHARLRRAAQRHRLPVHAADRGRPARPPDGLRGQPPLRLARARRSAPCCSPSTVSSAASALSGWLLGVLAVLLVTQALPLWDIGDDVWEGDFLFGGIVLAFFVVLVPVVLVLAGQRGASPVALIASAAPRPRDGRSGSAGGRATTTSTTATGPRPRPATSRRACRAALAWFNQEDPQDARIAVVGGRPGFKQYVFYGDDLSNHVQYVAHHGPHGAYTPIATRQHRRERIRPGPQCEEWQRRAQRRRLRLRRHRARPAHPERSPRSRPSGPEPTPPPTELERTT